MADISRITLPNGESYNIKDETARAAVAAGLTINVVGKLPDASKSTLGALYFVKDTHSDKDDIYDEFVTVSVDGTYSWEKIGNTDVDLTDYAKKTHTHTVTSNVTVGDHSYTPEGTISEPAFTGTEGDVVVHSKPLGEVSQPTFTGTQETVYVEGLPEGTVSISTGDGTANYTPSGEISQPTFSGSKMTATGSFTPAGTVEAPAVTVATKDKNNEDMDIYSMTSEGSVTAGSAASFTAGAFSAGTLPSWTAAVEGETLSFAWSTGTLPSHGEDMFTANTPTAVTMPSRAQVNVTASASAPAFTGKSGDVSVTGTPAGEISKPTFAGTGVDLEATFTGENLKAKGEFTPTGTVSKPTFTGSDTEARGTFTPVGTIAAPTFSGTKVTLTHSVTNGTATTSDAQ